MPKLPQIRSRELEAILLKKGFKFIRQKGSHRIYINADLKVVIPFHNKPLKRGTLSNILKQAKISL